jgi:uncharacterized lipoprotein YddW (UPF0748 family)
MLDDLTVARANAVFVEVRRRGDSYYLRSLEPPANDPDYAPTFDALQYVIERAHARGIEVHAWFPVTPAGTSSNAAHVSAQHGARAAGEEMWMTVSARGAVSTSLDPGHPAAARYLANVILEPARWYDVDGLHLDYIRYPEDADYGYNPTAIARFHRLRNKTGTPSASDPDWAAFRRDQVTALVRQIYLRSYEISRSIKISGSLITWGSGPTSDDQFRRLDAYSRVFQDWRGWLEEGILDLGIPMNYFREPQYPAWYDRWLEYEKDRQYNRGMLVGPAIYLNSISDSLAQMRRALAPSASGMRALGVCFYSYASTNILNAAGTPIQPNADFYRAAGEAFGAPAAVPAMPWKATPTRGHVLGNLVVDGGPAWLADGVAVFIESDTGGGSTRTATDATGFFGAVDLPPDRYRVRIERGGVELFRATPRDVGAGQAVRFDVALKASDFAAVVPRLDAASTATAPPGSLLTLSGAALGGMQETQVLVNGTAVALVAAAPTSLTVQLPWTDAAEWTIVARRAGMESAPFRVAYAAASPAILGMVRRGEYLEIYATGLGRVTPSPAPGATGSAAEPFNRTVLPVAVRIGEAEVAPMYSGLQPLAVSRYQVNVKLPEGVRSGVVRLVVGGQTSAPASFE